jgi:hypothetical protein
MFSTRNFIRLCSVHGALSYDVQYDGTEDPSVYGALSCYVQYAEPY